MSYQPKIAKGINKAIAEHRRAEFMRKTVAVCYFVAVMVIAWTGMHYLYLYDPMLHWITVRVMLAVGVLIMVKEKLSKKPDKLEIIHIREKTTINR